MTEPNFKAALSRYIAAHPPGFITVTDETRAVHHAHFTEVQRAMKRFRALDWLTRRWLLQLEDGAVEVGIRAEGVSGGDRRERGREVLKLLQLYGFTLKRGPAPNIAHVYPSTEEAAPCA